MKTLPIGFIMGLFLIVAGISHFIAPKTLDAIVPQFLPGDPRMWTYISGVAEIAIGVALLTPLSLKLGETPIRLIAAYGALLLFIAVYPANIKMAIDWRDRSMPYPLIAWARLPLQFGLFYWAWAIIKALKK
jgi:uncharacterized membrane protein